MLRRPRTSGHSGRRAASQDAVKRGKLTLPQDSLNASKTETGVWCAQGVMMSCCNTVPGPRVPDMSQVARARPNLGWSLAATGPVLQSEMDDCNRGISLDLAWRM